MGRPPKCNPCCQTPPEVAAPWDPPSCTCENPAYSQCYEFTLSTIAANSCGCDNLNGTYTVQHVGGNDCLWTGCYPGGGLNNSSSPCVGRNLFPRLLFDNPNTAELRIWVVQPFSGEDCNTLGGKSIVFYSGTTDCTVTEDIELALQTVGSPCTGWPATLTLAPVSCASAMLLAAPPAAHSRIEPEQQGPGTELQGILASIGIKPGPTCPCLEMMRKMNRWGVDGCRRHRGEIVLHLQEQMAARSWNEKLSAAALATVSGIAFRLNPVDVPGSMVDEAIRRANSRPVD